MRLGLIIYGSLSTISGGYLYDRQLVEHLTSQGDTVETLSLPWRGYPRHLVAAAFLRSQEAHRHFVADLYAGLLNRSPDAALDFWVGQLQAGLPEEWVLAFFLGSQEFWLAS